MKHHLSLRYRPVGRNIVLGPREISVPKEFEVGKYGKVIYNNTVCGVFKINYRIAPGDQLFVKDEDFGQVPDNSMVVLIGSSKWRFGTYDLFTSAPKLSSFIGLILAILGVLIDAVLAVDKAQQDLWSFETSTIVNLMLISMLFKVTGLLLIFFRGVLH